MKINKNLILKKSSLLLIILLITNSLFAQNFWDRIESPTDNFLRTLHFADSLRGWVAGDSGVVFYTSDGGISWMQQQTNTTNRIMKLFFLDDNIAWALAWDDEIAGDDLFYGTEILKTTDGGENWSGEQFREDNVFLRGIYFLDTLKGFAGGVPGKFYATTDGGVNWEPANIDSGTFSHFPVIDFNFYNKQYGFACGGRFDIAGVIWRTTNAGDSWTPIDGQYTPADEVWDIHFFDSLNVMGIGGDPDLFGVGIIRSTDAGESWDYFEIGVFGQALALSFRTENEGWAVVPHSESFVATFDYAETWNAYSSPESAKLYDIVFPDSLTGYAVGEEGVIVKYKYQPTTRIGQEPEYKLNDYTLNQNYPNPFNVSTTISYSLAESGKVELDIFNILGIKIDSLVDEYKQSGNHSIVWNADDQPSGVYYMQIDVEGKLKTKKMILLK